MLTNEPISNLRTHLGYWLRVVSNAISQNFARKVSAEGVTVAEWVFLRMLFDAESIAPSQLAENMGMTRGAISKLSDRLFEKSLIEREENPDDKRAHTLALTNAGRALVPRLARLADENDAEFFDKLPHEERLRLERILKSIVSQRDLKNIPIG
ncbi:MarR family transcriptional regulator [Sneathiella sp. CAU 1612]|uniref:MarR family transcriptional regulator n=1 Tax=Sneathiella sedimenti TaxID=2816034 RepID=A0ABS3F1G0_9PROT|nr:MarR family transcriptional regulator [Sneathiella sedimenti]MBO0332323.1 MarR family transcriptional regulator [Sneathiella sedimenti]